MRLRRRAAIAAAIVAMFAGCGRCGAPRSAAPPPAAPPAVVTVNGEAISVERLRRELARDLAPDADAGAIDPASRRRVVDDAIARKLLLQEARSRSVTVAPGDVDRRLASIRAEYPGPDFAALLAEEGVTEAELRGRVEEGLTIEKLVATTVFPTVRVSPEEVQRAYADHPERFQQPAEVHALQILVKTEDEARRLRDEVRKRPGSFADVARRASIAPEAASGGDLGWFSSESGMPEVFAACLDLPVRRISDVVPSPYGFHVFQVLERRPARRLPLEEVRPQIEERLLRDARARAQEAFVADLRQRAHVTVDLAALDALSP